MQRTFRLMILFCLMAGCMAVPGASQNRIHVDASKVIATLCPLLYGSGAEDVNHEIYGGLYDQRLFGESFEEGQNINAVEGFTLVGKPWHEALEGLYAYASPLSALISQKDDGGAGTAEVEMRFDGFSGNAGLLFHARARNEAAASIEGYSICLDGWTPKITVRKHEGTGSQIVLTCDASYEPNTCWNTLRVDYIGSRFDIYLNNLYVASYNDTKSGFANGGVGIVSLNGNATLRNLRMHHGKTETPLPFHVNGNGISDMWKPTPQNAATARFEVNSEGAYNGRRFQTIENTAGGRTGIYNEGLNHWGIGITRGQTMTGSISLKGTAASVTVALQSHEGRTLAEQRLTGIGTQWKCFDFKLKPSANDARGRFAIFVDGPGRIDIDQAMLFADKANRFKGLPFRNDIGQCLVREGLTFLRYGGTMINSSEYLSRNMLGAPGTRPPYRGTWYRASTNGFGIVEFVQFARAAGMEPAFALNIEDDPQDVARLIEYLNGNTATPMGRQRALDGHKEPYAVKYVEIGNEEVLQRNNIAGYRHYVERFLRLQEAMHRVDSTLQLVIAAWWRGNTPEMEYVFKALDGKAAYWDFHPWVDDPKGVRLIDGRLSEMENLFHQWNPQTTMRCVIFEENGSTHHIGRMLRHVITLNAVRRHGSFVLTSCQANALQPYRQNDNGWDQGQVFFTPTQVWAQPQYYAEQMAANNHQPNVVESRVEGTTDVDVSTTIDDNRRTLKLHIANTSNAEQQVELDIRHFGRIKHINALSLSGKPEDDNTPEQPTRIVPKDDAETVISTDKIKLRPNSYTIVTLRN